MSYFPPSSLAGQSDGTWTATITCIGGGTITLNAASNELSWTRVGKLVHILGQISVTSVSAPLGGMQINGLPFFSSNLTDNAGLSTNAIGIGNYTGTLDNAPEGAKTQSSWAWFTGRMQEGSKILQVRDGFDAGTSSSPSANIQAGTFFNINYIYTTNDA